MTKPDFSNIAAQGVKPDTTREYFFDTLVGEPSIVLAPAHDSNPAFLDERLRIAAERAKAVQAEAEARKARKGSRSGEITVEEMKKQMEDDRQSDREIIAAVCAKSWGTAPVDAKGKPVEFSAENCLAFLQALPDFIFDPFRNYAANVYNFIDRPKTDGTALGESQPSG